MYAISKQKIDACIQRDKCKLFSLAIACCYDLAITHNNFLFFISSYEPEDFSIGRITAFMIKIIVSSGT